MTPHFPDWETETQRGQGVHQTSPWPPGHSPDSTVMGSLVPTPSPQTSKHGRWASKKLAAAAACEQGGRAQPRSAGKVLSACCPLRSLWPGALSSLRGFRAGAERKQADTICPAGSVVRGSSRQPSSFLTRSLTKGRRGGCVCSWGAHGVLLLSSHGAQSKPFGRPFHSVEGAAARWVQGRQGRARALSLWSLLPGPPRRGGQGPLALPHGCLPSGLSLAQEEPEGCGWHWVVSRPASGA